MLVVSMNTNVYMIAIFLAALFCGGCEESYRMEVAVPVGGSASTHTETQTADPLEVQIAVEKIASANGLKTYIEQAHQEDLFRVVDDVIDTSSANTRTWKHSEHPVFLSMTRHKGEFVLLLNYAQGEKPNPNAQRIYRALEKQLRALPVELVTANTPK